MPAPRSRNGTPSRVEQLAAAAPTREVNNMITLKYYYRSANFLLQQAQAYRKPSSQDQLYVMLMRFVSLVLETIPRHQNFNKNSVDNTYISLEKKCVAVLDELARLKASLNLPDPATLQSAPYLPKQIPGAVQLSAGHVAGLHWDEAPSDTLDLSALENLGSPQWAALSSSSGAGSAAAPSAARPPLQLPDLTSSLALPAASQATLDKHAILPPAPPSQAGAAAGRGAAEAERPLYSDLLASLHPGSTSSAPEAPPPEAHVGGLGVSPAAIAALRPPSPYDGALQLGPQEVGVMSAPHPTAPPPPLGEPCCPPGGAAAPRGVGGGVAEVRKRQKVRNVHVSAGLMDEFLRYALSNTRRNVETCGILAGSLSPDDARFNVTTLIVPKQEGSTDMVQALAEEEIFLAQDSRSLYPLGWIHTHPSQTCFLSSIDVHTQCGYQTMLDEAIAIVMAPRDARTPVGIFRLTTPGGLALVQRCQQRGFHPHPPTATGQPVYELSGHVYLNPRIKFEVVDLR